jgi:hypothetical protein
MTDNQQNNTESEGIFGYEKNVSYHFQHWKRESELDGDLYASPVSIYEDGQSVQRSLLGFYGRFVLFVFARVSEYRIGAFSQYICFSGNGPSMRKGQ